METPVSRPRSPFTVREVVPNATAPKPVPHQVSLDDSRLYFNRELSWLDFNWRVAHQARDERIPLLERVFFLAIAASNLDEFFRKRVGGLKRQVAAGVHRGSPDGRMPGEQLEFIREAVLKMTRYISETWEDILKPRLASDAGISVLNYSELDEGQKSELHDYFVSRVFPILTPLAVDPGHPFPFISNQSLSLAVTLRHPKRDTEHFARLKVPTGLPRWLPLGDSGRFVPLEQVIAHNVHELFRGMKVVSVYAFRVTRNADLERDEEEADDLISMISEELRERRFAPIVRLEVEKKMPRDVRDLLLRELSLSADDMYELDGNLDLSGTMAIARMDHPDHRYESWEPIIPGRLLHEGESKDRLNIFEVIRAGDLMVHHPYESFAASTQRFVEEAAGDPHVLAIKQTLYRTSEESPIIDSLIRAAEAGKQVAVLIEVKARFDEKSNIRWGQKLEKSGVHVTYGLVGLKTHTKCTLVIRQEGDALRTYCHIGTGNYNPATARGYTDIGLLTCSEDIGNDVVNLFHYLTGYAPEQHYRRLVVAPRDMRSSFTMLVRREVENQQKHGNGRIVAKMNALDDTEMIKELYRASEAGVQIDLIVRGHCRLRPGLKQYSENIRVISVIGRFLEHSRIYYFGNNEAPRVFIGSADWQRRNLEDRVEVIAEIDDPSIKARLIRTLRFAQEDNSTAWELHPDGSYRLRFPDDESGDYGFQQVLMNRALDRFKEADPPWDIE
ncbi:MAG: polyphosphate kinase 1 [Rhodothermales bacterium]|nr:polyphosphate kinase 1 [Rhodothermales bacterium]